MKILNFGSLNIDYVYKVDHFVAGGETIASQKLDVYSGGKGLNQSVACSKAGMEVYHAGKIGEDGRFLLDVLMSAGVHTDYICVSGTERTGNAIIQNDSKGDNCIILYGGSNLAIEKEKIDEILSHFGEGDTLLLQNEISNIPYIVEQAYLRKMKIILNPSPMDENIANIDFRKLNLVILNEIEASQLTGIELTGVKDCGAEDLADSLRSKYPFLEFVLTLGENGSLYISSASTVRQGIYKVDAVDSTAAGDTFTGYLVAGIAKGFGIRRALDLAAKAAALSVTHMGAAPSIPTMQEVRQTVLEKIEPI